MNFSLMKAVNYILIIDYLRKMYKKINKNICPSHRIVTLLFIILLICKLRWIFAPETTSNRLCSTCLCNFN